MNAPIEFPTQGTYDASMIRVAGIVLCGGKSQRMGSTKAWLPIAGERMLPRVVRLLSEDVNPIVVVSARDQELPPLPAEVRIFHDEQEGRGPLQGLAAGLAALDEQSDAAFVSSCDVPFMRPAFVRRMIDLLNADQVCVPRIDGRPHPLAAVYRVNVLDEVRRLLLEDRLRVMDLYERVATRFVDADELRDVDPTLESLANVNTPEEYERVLRMIENRSSSN